MPQQFLKNIEYEKYYANQYLMIIIILSNVGHTLYPVENKTVKRNCVIGIFQIFQAQ